MTYAIVKISGKQFKVKEGDIVLVNKIEGEKGAKLEFKEVFLLNSESGIKIGQPWVSGVSVKAEIVEQVKGDKIMVSKFKSKVRHRRKMGFRAKLTQIKITSIETGEKKAKEEVKVEKKPIKAKKPVKK